MTETRLFLRLRWRVLATALALTVVGACAEPLDPPTANQELQEMDADNVIFGMSSFLSVSGVREGRIEADTAYMFADSSTAHLRQLEIVFFDGEGREIASVTGSRGRWRHDTNVMDAYGDVVLFVHADSSTLESAEIHYDPQMDRIWSDSASVRTMPNGSVTSGSAFESDTSFENIVIRNPRGGLRRGS